MPCIWRRLKDKLGNRSNASSEAEFLEATGWLLGEEGEGVRQILKMGGLTRFDCALGSPWPDAPGHFRWRCIMPTSGRPLAKT
ncbi:Putative acyl-CoA dehydrogenase AidB [Leclercia adecarboxylata]|nr:Putative acyl-CoA dehydrogenase AidB [Leclercia adecarboxylata]